MQCVCMILLLLVLCPVPIPCFARKAISYICLEVYALACLSTAIGDAMNLLLEGLKRLRLPVARCQIPA